MLTGTATLGAGFLFMRAQKMILGSLSEDSETKIPRFFNAENVGTSLAPDGMPLTWC